MAALLERFIFRRPTSSKHAAAARIALAALALIAVLLIAFNFGGICEDFIEMGRYLQYGFIRRALIVGTLVSLCAALLGVTLVLKRYSMIGDGLSHVGFGALAIAASLGFVTAESLPAFLPAGFRSVAAGFCSVVSENPLPFTLVVVIAVAFLVLRLNANSRLNGDAAIALLSTSALAVGVLLTSITSGMNVEIMNYMFGSILAMRMSDVILSIVLSVIVLLVFALFCNRIFAITFDENFARATGTKSGLINMMISILTAVTIVTGMRMMGTMLISSLIIFPALSSMRVYSRFMPVLICSAIISVLCFAFGLMLSCLHAIPAGAAIVLTNLAVFIVFSLIERARG